jgi:hypothetical protein
MLHYLLSHFRRNEGTGVAGASLPTLHEITSPEQVHCMHRTMELFNTENPNPGCLDRAVATILCDREAAAKAGLADSSSSSSSSSSGALPRHCSYQRCEQCHVWKLDNGLPVSSEQELAGLQRQFAWH